ncbi:Na(+)/H(+) antiporter subunit C [Brachybacterium sp. J153]|uniref:Na(+)/H(+) antiporter subunit C n=1 Tax=Brachybacterium sp. J153 TaxID=3116488 RepID=UPI002E75BA41|nr:Na(+)/H(+) antiporter subunit C [Brachybacterium sp. J153]MEE1618068.1 Na(+)/H(+) antiporter subunit C [Brachybacterium sp. J153]
MPVSLLLLLTAGILIACGVYLVLERTLSRVILGFVLLGNGVNVLFIVAAGPQGLPPFEGTGDPAEMTDPLPFAMVLTAIVIALGITAFGVALSYRAWQLFGHDEVPDDVEDRRVLRRRRRRAEDVEDLPWSQALSEETRRGALMHSQGFGPDDSDALGSDLSSAEDVPQDHTEADEGESSSLRAQLRRRRERRHGAADAPGTARASDTPPAPDAPEEES